MPETNMIFHWTGVILESSIAWKPLPPGADPAAALAMPRAYGDRGDHVATAKLSKPVLSMKSRLRDWKCLRGCAARQAGIAGAPPPDRRDHSPAGPPRSAHS